MGEPIAFLILMFGFLPLAFIITSQWTKAFLLSPVISFSLAAFVAQAHVVFDISLGQIFLSLMAMQFLAVLAVLLRKSSRERLLTGLKQLKSKQTSISAMAIIFSALAYISAGPPLAWDARSIWLSKASWLNGPASQYLIAQQDGLSGHPDYPLAGPSMMASYWDFQGVAENLQAGVSIIAFLPILILGLGSLCLYEALFGDEIRWIHVGFAFFLFGVSAFAANDMIGSGYMDVPLSTTVLAIALLSLAYLIKPRLDTMVVIVLLVLIANNLKQEGQIFVLVTVIVVALAFLLASRNYKRALKFLAPVGLVFVLDRLVWSWFSGFAGLPESSSTSSIVGNLTEIVQPGSMFYELLAQLIDRVGFVNLLFWQVVVIAVIITSRLAFKSLVDSKTMLFLLALPVASAGIYVVTALTYTLGGARDRLDWWLGTSYGRITSTPELMLVGGLFVVALVISSKSQRLFISKSSEDSNEELENAQ